MKAPFVIILFLILFSATAQNDSIALPKRSVVATNKMNVVYRGIMNPISIAVADCKSYEVSAPGLQKVSEGKYTLAPGQGLETKVVVNIVNHDDTVSIEEHIFRIKSIPKMMGKINDQNCYSCIVEVSKGGLEKAIITIGYNDFTFDMDETFFKVESFKVVLRGEKIKVVGNKFSPEALKLLSKLKTGTVFLIEDIQYPNPLDSCRSLPLPVTVMIVDDLKRF